MGNLIKNNAVIVELGNGISDFFLNSKKYGIVYMSVIRLSDKFNVVEMRRLNV